MFNAAPSDEYDYLFKVVVVGDSQTGKTNILSRFTKDTFKEEILPTIGVEFGTKNVQLEGKTIKAQVWDTAGQERYMAITSAYYRGAVGALIIYDITERSSFSNVETWINQIKDNGIVDLPIVLVGNKADLESKRKVTTKEAKEYADEHKIDFVETSAKTTSGVDKAFEKLLTGIMNKVGKHLDVGNTLSPNKKNAETPVGLADPRVQVEEKGAELGDEDEVVPRWVEDLISEITEMKERLKVVDKLEAAVETMCKRMDAIETRVSRLETRKVDFKTAQSKSVKK